MQCRQWWCFKAFTQSIHMRLNLGSWFGPVRTTAGAGRFESPRSIRMNIARRGSNRRPSVCSCRGHNGTRNYATGPAPVSRPPPSVIQRQRTEEEDASVALLGYMCLDPRQPGD
jgi:hypothetical protein